MKELKNNLPQSQLQARNQLRIKDEDDPRGYYFRDATAIMHSTAFRRLKHKTQVFFAPSNDHVCTRLEHVLHVSSIAVTICKALNLNTDMAWAIGLGHDLGHTPFGHLGEEILSNLTKRKFCHELHSLRVVDVLANLNLTYAVRDGIVTHCGERFEQVIHPTHKITDISAYTDRSNYPATFEGVVVRMADKIAYLGRDYEDAITLGLLQPHDMPQEIITLLGGEKNTNIINSFTRDVISHAHTHQAIGFSDNIHQALQLLKDFNYTHIYKSPTLEAQKKKFSTLLEIVYECLYESTNSYKNDIKAYQSSEYEIVQRFGAHIENHSALYKFSSSEAASSQDIYIDALIDYIAGMTDDYVISTVKQQLFPQIPISRI